MEGSTFTTASNACKLVIPTDRLHAVVAEALVEFDRRWFSQLALCRDAIFGRHIDPSAVDLLPAHEVVVAMGRKLTRQMHNRGNQVLGHPSPDNVLRSGVCSDEATQRDIIDKNLTGHFQLLHR